MNTQNIIKQRGFFDLGISLLVLALGGGTVILTNSNQEVSDTAAVETTIETTAVQDLRAWDIDS